MTSHEVDRVGDINKVLVQDGIRDILLVATAGRGEGGIGSGLVVGELQEGGEAADESRCLGFIENALAGGSAGGGGGGASSRDGLSDRGSGVSSPRAGAGNGDSLGDNGGRAGEGHGDSDGLLSTPG